MHLFKMVVSKDSAWHAMQRLGSTEQVHILNLNEKVSPFELAFTSNLQRCKHMEQMLIKMQSILKLKDNKMSQSEF